VIFDEPILEVTRQNRSIERLELLSKFVAASEAAFPHVRIRLLTKIAAVNAQASVLDQVARVDLFGGLIFHPALGQDALAFTLAHELGHHLAIGPRYACSSRLACDCAADVWAVTKGFNVLSLSDPKLNMGKALHQLRSIMPRKGTPIRGLSRCWALDWRRRERSLIARRFVSVSECQMLKRVRGAQDGWVDTESK
jgi:hypothetical protein